MALVKMNSESIFKPLEGKFDPTDQVYATLDQLMLATKLQSKPKLPRKGVQTRSMAKAAEMKIEETKKVEK
jgi:hypothetical protein